MRMEMDAALDQASEATDEVRAELEAEHAARVAEMEREMTKLEETMSRQAGVSKAEAEAGPHFLSFPFTPRLTRLDSSVVSRSPTRLKNFARFTSAKP